MTSGVCNYSPVAGGALLAGLLEILAEYQSRQREYQLILAQDVLKKPTLYRSLRRFYTNDATVILDNGAAEGERLTPDELFQAAVDADVSHIVLQDVIGDAQDTVTAAYQMYSLMKQRNITFEPIGVVQGSDLGEAMWCFQVMRRWGITYFGVPRWMANSEAFGYTRRDVVEYIQTVDPNVKIHLLGTSRDLADDLLCSSLSGAPGLLGSQVQGIDSANPIVSVIEGTSVTCSGWEHHSRPMDYLDLELARISPYGSTILHEMARNILQMEVLLETAAYINAKV